jgi:hypothetical protein
MPVEEKKGPLSVFASVARTLRDITQEAEHDKNWRAKITGRTPEAIANAALRGAPRIPMKLPVRLSWTDKEGIPRIETGTTHNVNAKGAQVVLPQLVPNGIKLEITNLVSQGATRGRVVWAGKAVNDGEFAVGIELEQANPNFWARTLD